MDDVFKMLVWIVICVILFGIGLGVLDHCLAAT